MTQTAAGVLDMKAAGTTVACALADASLALYRCCFTNDEDSPDVNTRTLEPLATLSHAGEGLFLSVDWVGVPYALDAVPNTREQRWAVTRPANDDDAWGPAAQVAVSTQEGSVLVFDGEAGAVSYHAANAHPMGGANMPVWVVAASPHAPATLASGGDDCALRLWDTRAGSDAGPTGVNTKSHEAGVSRFPFPTRLPCG
jgi:WD40 repeat protein